MSESRAWIAKPFFAETGLNWPVLTAFIFINAVVLYNALFHDPRIGYDTTAFIVNIDILSEGRLPAESESPEFFTPPLAFLPPAALKAALDTFLPDAYSHPPDEHWLPTFLHYHFTRSIPDFNLALAAKFAQLLNLLYSLLLTFTLLKICLLLRPGDIRLRLYSLIFLGLLPVYYKTFAFVRPEPLLAALVLLAAYLTLEIYHYQQPTSRRVAALGLLLGLIALARQWGFAVFPALVLFALLLKFKASISWRAAFQPLLVSFSLAFLVGGWFYLLLWRDYGSPLAFNRQPAGQLTIEDTALDFTGLGLDRLFTDPLYTSFRGQVLPTFYSETWGDYWHFFVVSGIEKETGIYIDGNYINHREAQEAGLPPQQRRWQTNRYEIAAYLGRVNLAALLPTAFLLAGLALAIYRLILLLGSPSPAALDLALAALVLFPLVSLAAYTWFLVTYTHGDPTTIKASYMLQVFPFLSILSAEVVLRIAQRFNRLLAPTLLLLALAALYYLPVFFTRYNTW